MYAAAATKVWLIFSETAAVVSAVCPELFITNNPNWSSFFFARNTSRSVGEHWNSGICVVQLVGTSDEGRTMLVSFGPPGDLFRLVILAGDGYADIADRPPSEIPALILQ
ncbi:MAG: hypothetical protein KDB27_34570 [Planctomycetales bacterium]|nr:hypothetical protein [Planctomycetales bacterium]